MRRMIGLAALMAACAAFVMGTAAAGAQTVPSDTAAVTATGNSGDYGETDGYDDYATTTEAPTTTTAAPTTTTAAPTTTVAEVTTTVAPQTTMAPVKVANATADPARPAVTKAADELASTGLGNAGLAVLGLGAIALGISARRVSTRRR